MNEMMLSKRGGIYDPYYSNVIVLMHMNTSGFLDQKGHVFSNANTTWATEATDYTGYARFNGSTSVLQTPTTAEFAFGQADFTLEARIRRTAAGNALSQFMGMHQYGAGANWMLLTNTSGQVTFYSPSGVQITSSNSVPLNVWTHVTVVKTNGVIKIYIGGVLGASTANTESLNFGYPFSLGGSSNNNAAVSFLGHIDEVRLTKNICRYLAPFTPPVAPHPDK